jgi:hypothetical protein
MDSPFFCATLALWFSLAWRSGSKQKESDMNATTVAVDLAKSVFQLTVADEHWRVVETQRLTRTQFERWFLNREVGLVIMEACGSAHHWGALTIPIPCSVKNSRKPGTDQSSSRQISPVITTTQPSQESSSVNV